MMKPAYVRCILVDAAQDMRWLGELGGFLERERENLLAITNQVQDAVADCRNPQSVFCRPTVGGPERVYIEDQ
jgi:hypothetical protein